MKEGASDKVADNIGDAIGRYLISKTQFDFGKGSQSAAQRSLGQAFTMFTTWPINIAADVAHQFRDAGAKQGFKNVARKYMAPFGLLATASALMQEEQSPLSQYLIGKSEEYAPIAYILPKDSGSGGRSVLSNPLIDTITGAVAPLFKGEVRDSLRKAAQAGMTSYVPLVAPVINEADKFTKIFNGEKISDRALRNIGLGKKDERD